MSNLHILKLGIKNIIFSIISQGVSMILGIVTGFILPKVLGVIDYGYWQIYLFYVGYIMVLSFGFGDGLYLRYGHLNYTELPFEKIRTSVVIFLFVTLLATASGLFLLFFIEDLNKKNALGGVVLNIFIVCLNGVILSVLQFTNRIKLNSTLVVSVKILFVVFLILEFIFINNIKFQYVIIADIISKIIILGIGLYKTKEVFWGAKKNFKIGIKEYCENVSSGFKLTISTILGTFILGIGRIVIEKTMPIDEYSYYSFSTTIILFALNFISAASISVYPLLKRLSPEKSNFYFEEINVVITSILFLFLVLYKPFSAFIKLFYLDYIRILEYLPYFFIILVLQSKIQFLLNTFYIIFRKEKELLKINILNFIFALILVLVLFNIFKTVEAIVIGTMLSIFIRYYLSEKYIYNLFGKKIPLLFFLEIIYLSSFGLMQNIKFGFFIEAILIFGYFIYLFLNRKKFKILLNYLKKIK